NPGVSVRRTFSISERGRLAVPTESVGIGHRPRSNVRNLRLVETSTPGTRSNVGEMRPGDADTICGLPPGPTAPPGHAEAPDLAAGGFEWRIRNRSLGGDRALHAGMDLADEGVRAGCEGRDAVGHLLARDDLALEHAGSVRVGDGDVVRGRVLVVE